MAPLMRRSRRSSAISFPLLASGIALFLFCQLYLAYHFLWGRHSAKDLDTSAGQLSLGYISLGENAPLLSIIVPVVGASEKELKSGFAALEGVFGSGPGFEIPIEVVVIHANSLFSHGLPQFGSANPNLSVHYVRLPHGVAHSDAWNLAVQHYIRGALLTKVDFLGFVRGEVTHKMLRRLEKKVELLHSNPQAQVAFSRFEEEGGGSVVSSREFFSFDERKPVAGLVHELDRSPVWRRTLRESVGLFDPTFGSAAEWAFWLKALQNGQLAMHLTDESVGGVHASEPRLRASDELAVVSRFLFSGVVNLTAESVQSKKASGLRVLVVHEHVPFRNEGGDNRLMQVVKSLLDRHHKVWYLYRGWGGKPVHRSKLEALGVHLIPDAQLTDERFDREIRRLRNPGAFFESHDFDVAILSAWFYKKNNTAEALAPSIPEAYSQLIKQYNPKSCIAVLTDDIHWARNMDSNWCHEKEGYECFGRVKDREQRVYLDSDVLFTVSEGDAVFLRVWLPTLPHPPSFLPYVGSVRTNHVNHISHREVITFVGSNHPVNEAGLRWFFDAVVPILRNLLNPLPHIYLVGEGWRDSPLSNPLGVWAPGLLKSDAELDKYLQRTRVFISPMVKGTGQQLNSCP
jgi:hypothetical protein